MKDDEPDEPLEFQDSEDSDPAWTPMAKDGDEEIVLPLKKNKRNRQGTFRGFIKYINPLLTNWVVSFSILFRYEAEEGEKLDSGGGPRGGHP